MTTDELRELAQQEVDLLLAAKREGATSELPALRIAAVERVGAATGWDRALHNQAATEATDGSKPTGLMLRDFLIDLATWP